MSEEGLAKNDAQRIPDPAAAFARMAQQAKDAVADAAVQGAKVAAAGAKIAAEQGSKAAAAGAAAAAAAKQIHQAFGAEYGDTFEGNIRDEDGRPIVPDPLVDELELKELDEIAKRYEKLASETKIQKLGKKAIEATPQQVKDAAKTIGGAVEDSFNGLINSLTEQQLIAEAFKTAAEGLGELGEQAAKMSIGRDYVLQKVNAGKQHEKVSELNEICLLRAYDISKAVGNEKLFHMGIAAIEGGGTGAAGYAGIPLNLVLSMLVYFRAVQSVAMFYGYDVKNDPAELMIAGDVFTKALSPSGASTDAAGAAGDYIGKIMLFAQGEGVKHAAKKGWQAMAEKKGSALLIAQLRATANKAAEKALKEAGKKGLEEGILKDALKPLGSKLTLKTVGKGVPIFGAGFGALFDVGEMHRIVDFADLFYCKRFIMEKPERVKRLCGNITEIAVDAAEAAAEE